MTIDRRTFMLVTGLAPVAPLLAKVTTESALGDSGSCTRLQERTARTTEAYDLVLKIDGWSVGDETRNEVWFSVDRSWRAAWR